MKNISFNIVFSAFALISGFVGVNCQAAVLAEQPKTPSWQDRCWASLSRSINKGSNTISYFYKKVSAPVLKTLANQVYANNVSRIHSVIKEAGREYAQDKPVKDILTKVLTPVTDCVATTAASSLELMQLQAITKKVLPLSIKSQEDGQNVIETFVGLMKAEMPNTLKVYNVVAQVSNAISPKYLVVQRGPIEDLDLTTEQDSDLEAVLISAQERNRAPLLDVSANDFHYVAIPDYFM